MRRCSLDLRNADAVLGCGVVRFADWRRTGEPRLNELSQLMFFFFVFCVTTLVNPLRW
jgi:hypothetical protein